MAPLAPDALLNLKVSELAGGGGGWSIGAVEYFLHPDQKRSVKTAKAESKIGRKE